jgi:hypothetical protein
VTVAGRPHRPLALLVVVVVVVVAAAAFGVVTVFDVRIVPAVQA